MNTLSIIQTIIESSVILGLIYWSFNSQKKRVEKNESDIEDLQKGKVDKTEFDKALNAQTQRFETQFALHKEHTDKTISENKQDTQRSVDQILETMNRMDKKIDRIIYTSPSERTS